MREIVPYICERLEQMDIAFEMIEHEPAASMEECARNDALLNAVTAKNYFLATRHTGKYYLCITEPAARLRTADVSKQAGSSRLGFGSEEKLSELLNTYPGAVTPLGLLFDTQHAVTLLVDRELLKRERIAFHPCDNTCTVAMRTKDFFGIFLPALNRTPVFVDMNAE